MTVVLQTTGQQTRPAPRKAQRGMFRRAIKFQRAAGRAGGHGAFHPQAPTLSGRAGKGLCAWHHEQKPPTESQRIRTTEGQGKTSTAKNASNGLLFALDSSNLVRPDHGGRFRASRCASIKVRDAPPSRSLVASLPPGFQPDLPAPPRSSHLSISSLLEHLLNIYCPPADPSCVDTLPSSVGTCT